MRCHVRLCLFVGVLLACLATLQPVYGAGFGLYEGSARGNALGGTLVGRADDPSAIYYNPAGITQLKGCEVEGGATFITPATDVRTTSASGQKTTSSKDNTWIPPHLYGTYQASDSIWLGMGIYSRFGLGTEFPSTWPGRYNSYDARIETVSYNPDVALKINDQLSVAAGVQAVTFDMKLKRKLPYQPNNDLDLSLTGDAVGYGYNLGIRYAPLKWLALGAAYQSQVDEDIDGQASIHVKKTDASGDITLPDEIFLGVTFKPLDKLSLEIGALRTGWSSYDQLKIKFDDPTVLGKSESITPKDWDDVWRYQFGVEYSLTDKWDLRAGYVIDQEPIPDSTVDYLVPANDRQLYSVGCGYKWSTWALDLSYTYLRIDDRTVDARPADGVLPSEFENGDAHMIGVSVTKKI